MKKLYFKKNSSLILTCIGAVGVVATGITSALATSNYINKLKAEEKEKQRNLTKSEKVVLAIPNYIPPVAIGAGTIICMFSANTLSKQHQAAITSAYTLVNESFKEYRNKLIELHGEDADREIRDAIARERCDYHCLDLDVPDEKVIFYEPISGESKECYEREIMDAEYHFNRNYVLRGYALLNELYLMLGFPETNYGETVGWEMCSGITWIDFEHRLVERDDGGKPIYSIDTVFAPEPLEEW